MGMLQESIDIKGSGLIDFSLVKGYNDFNPDEITQEAKARQGSGH